MKANVYTRSFESCSRFTTSMVQRLARADHVLVAAPAYLKRHGEPKAVAELATHSCIAYKLSRTPGVWEMTENGSTQRVAVGARLQVNNSLAIRDAVLAGAGISLVPRFYVEQELRQRKLRAVPTLRSRQVTRPATCPR